MLCFQRTSNTKSFNDKKKKKNNLGNDILKKCQMNYNTFLKENKDVTMSGTKRYEDKSGQYYLHNSIKFQRNKSNLLNKKSITKPTLTNYQNNNKNLIRVNKKKLYEELVPIPKIKQKNKIKSEFDKKNLNNAVNNAKYIRRYQYSKNLIQKQIHHYNEIQTKEKIIVDKIRLIQIWWKTIFQIIKLQKNIKGFLYRNKLLKIIEKQRIYFDKMINMIKIIKYIFKKKYFLKFISFKPGLIYYFTKWKDIAFKNSIIKKIVKYLTRAKQNNEFDYSKEDYFKTLISRSCKDLIKENCKINSTNKTKNNNSIINLSTQAYTNKNSSMTSLPLKIKKNRLSLGLDTSCSKFFNTCNINNLEINKTLNIDKNTKDKTNKNMMNISQKLNLNKERKTENNPNKINYRNEIRSTILNSNYKTKNEKKTKNDVNVKKKKRKKKSISTSINVQNHLVNIKNKNKVKKNRVYENELNLYNYKYQTIDTNAGNNFININKELQDYSETNLDESQFNELLDNSTVKDNININQCFSESKKNKLEEKLITVEINNEYEDKNITLKKHFQKWQRLYIIQKLFGFFKIRKGMNIIYMLNKKRMFRLFLGRLGMVIDIIAKEDLQYFVNDINKKNIIKYLKMIGNKYALYKYFNKYKYKISIKLIIEKLKEFSRNKRKTKKEENKTKSEANNYYYLDDQFISSIPINNDFIQNKFNLNSRLANNCFIINNLNYNNNTNNIDIKLSCESKNKNEKKIETKRIELPKKNTKQNKPYIGLYKKHNSQNINDNYMNQNRNLNINMISQSQLYIRDMDKNLDEKNNTNFKESNTEPLINEINTNKSFVLSKHSNLLNWDFITKKNQLIMVINIIERHRKLKSSKLFNEIFKIWKSNINLNKSYNKIKDENVFLNPYKPKLLKKNKNEINIDLNKSNVYERKVSLNISIAKKNKNININENNNIAKEYKNKNINTSRISSLNSKLFHGGNKYYTYSLPDFSDTKKENNKISSIYKKKAILGPSNFPKKHYIVNSVLFDDDNFIYNKQNIMNIGYMSPENYYGFKKLDKIEEMEISFSSSKKKNYTISNDKIQRRKYDKIKYIKPFIIDDIKEKKFPNKLKNNNMIIEAAEENNENDIGNKNLLLNLKSYFNEKNEEKFNTFKQGLREYDSDLNVKMGIKKYKSQRNIL